MKRNPSKKIAINTDQTNEGLSKSFKDHSEGKKLHQWNFVSVITGPCVHYGANIVPGVCTLSLQEALNVSNLPEAVSS